MNLLERWRRGRREEDGDRDSGLFSFSFFLFQGLRESRKQNVAVFWEGKRRGGGQPFASFFLFFFLFPFSFFLFFCVQCFSTKRNETKRNKAQVCGSYSSFMNDLEMSPKKKIQIIFI